MRCMSWIQISGSRISNRLSHRPTDLRRLAGGNVHSGVRGGKGAEARGMGRCSGGQGGEA